jgi:hypothetical protein
MVELLTDPVRSHELGDAGLQRLSQAWDVAAGTVIESLDEAMVRTGRGK